MEDDSNDMSYSADRIHADLFTVTLTRSRTGFSWRLTYSGTEIGTGTEKTEERALAMAQAVRMAWTHLELAEISAEMGAH